MLEQAIAIFCICDEVIKALIEDRILKRKILVLASTETEWKPSLVPLQAAPKIYQGEN